MISGEHGLCQKDGVSEEKRVGVHWAAAESFGQQRVGAKSSENVSKHEELLIGFVSESMDKTFAAAQTPVSWNSQVGNFFFFQDAFFTRGEITRTLIGLLNLTREILLRGRYEEQKGGGGGKRDAASKRKEHFPSCIPPDSYQTI